MSATWYCDFCAADHMGSCEWDLAMTRFDDLLDAFMEACLDRDAEAFVRARNALIDAYRSALATQKAALDARHD